MADERQMAELRDPHDTHGFIVPGTMTDMTDAPLVLGIETSCDETGVGIVRGHTLLSDAVASSVDASTTDISAVDLVSPVVVANIEARILVPMAAELGRHVAPGGLLLLSGILVPQRDDVRAAYPEFSVVASPAMGEWTLLALRKP